MVMNNKQLKRGPGRPCIYPWHKWLARGKKTRLIKGRDFNCETRSMELLARRQSANRGVKSYVTVRDLTVIIEVE